MGVLFLWEKELAALGQLFPGGKAPPYPLAHRAPVMEKPKIVGE
jgi:hypothetical protein